VGRGVAFVGVSHREVCFVEGGEEGEDGENETLEAEGCVLGVPRGFACGRCIR
jgi:hypothetical protein